MRLVCAEQTARVRTTPDELRRIRELTRSINALEREFAVLVAGLAPQLPAERGCSVLTAAEPIGAVGATQRGGRKRRQDPGLSHAPDVDRDMRGNVSLVAWAAASHGGNTVRIVIQA